MVRACSISTPCPVVRHRRADRALPHAPRPDTTMAALAAPVSLGAFPKSALGARRDVRGAATAAVHALEQVRELGRVAPRARGGHGEPTPGRERAARGSCIGRGGGGGAHRARDATRRGRAERGVEGRGKHARDDLPHGHALALAALVVGRGTRRRAASRARHFAKGDIPTLDNSSRGAREPSAKQRDCFQISGAERAPHSAARPLVPERRREVASSREAISHERVPRSPSDARVCRTSVSSSGFGARTD